MLQAPPPSTSLLLHSYPLSTSHCYRNSCGNSRINLAVTCLRRFTRCWRSSCSTPSVLSRFALFALLMLDHNLDQSHILHSSGYSIRTQSLRGEFNFQIKHECQHEAVPYAYLGSLPDRRARFIFRRQMFVEFRTAANESRSN